MSLTKIGSIGINTGIQFAGVTTITSLNSSSNVLAVGGTVNFASDVSIGGSVSIGGTLTYEDVTNIDSIGIITARSGIDVDDFISVGSNIHLGNAGVVTATTFSGSGASLTSLPAANLTGTLPAISGANLTNLPSPTPANSDIQVAYTVTANGSSAYRFEGNGVVSSADNPDIYLIRGQKYRFINNSGGSHPFQIRVSNAGSAYSTGVTNNGASSGNIDFAPTYDSPAQLVYQCTNHGSMVGNIYLREAVGNNTNVGITTFSGFVNVNGNFGLQTSSPVAQTTSGSVALTPVLDLKGTGSLANASGVLQFTRKDNATQGSCIYSAGEDAGLTFRNTDSNGFGFYNGTTLALRIAPAGAIGLGGANYGTSGQVLTSQGSGSAPIWSTAASGKVLKFTAGGSTSEYNCNNSSFQNTHSVSHTPVSSTSKFIILYMPVRLVLGGSTNGYLRCRDGSGSTSDNMLRIQYLGSGGKSPHMQFYMPTSRTAGSSTTFTIQGRDASGSNDDLILGDNGTKSTLIVVEIEV